MIEAATLTIVIAMTYMSASIFFAWMSGSSIHDLLNDEGFDSDIAAWWFWYPLIFLAYPAGAAIYCFFKGISFTVKEAIG